MYYYKFKVFYDEVEDFVRDVDVLANTNFEDFHLRSPFATKNGTSRRR